MTGRLEQAWLSGVVASDSKETAMPRFFFDCRHESCDEDCIGHDLPNHRQAHEMAIQFAGEILTHEFATIADGHDLAIKVTDESGLVLYSFYAASHPSPATR
jgi:hypothetical protein